MTVSLKDSLSDRFSKTVNVAWCLVLDGALLAVWLTIAWGSHVFAKYIESQGVHEWAAEAFKWVSSVGTLVLASVYIAADIYTAWKSAFGRPTSGSK